MWWSASSDSFPPMLGLERSLDRAQRSIVFAQVMRMGN
jgi:hypothetical protein